MLQSGTAVCRRRACATLVGAVNQPAEESHYFEKSEHTGDVGARSNYDDRPWTVALTHVDNLQDTRTKKLHSSGDASEEILIFFSLAATHRARLEHPDVLPYAARALSSRVWQYDVIGASCVCAYATRSAKAHNIYYKYRFGFYQVTLSFSSHV